MGGGQAWQAKQNLVPGPIFSEDQQRVVGCGHRRGAKRVVLWWLQPVVCGLYVVGRTKCRMPDGGKKCKDDRMAGWQDGWKVVVHMMSVALSLRVRYVYKYDVRLPCVLIMTTAWPPSWTFFNGEGKSKERLPEKARCTKHVLQCSVSSYR